MNIGDYVRTSSGIIAKYLGREGNKYKFDKDIYWFYEYYNDYIYDDDYEEWLKNEDVKVSKELIDLIEVGDIVNGKQVTRTFIDPFTKKRRLEIEGTEINWQGDMSSIYIENEDIKSIVTHQQFKEMEYKIKK